MLEVDHSICISCDSCNILIGLDYFAQDFVDVGVSKLCKFCAESLDRNKFLILEDRPKSAVVMIPTGEKITVSKKELKKFLRKLNRHFVGVPCD